MESDTTGYSIVWPRPPDWSKEHNLDDRYPWKGDKSHRIDVDDPDADDEPDINWYDYVECEYGCKKHFYITKHINTCSYCNGPSCMKCAKKKFRKCSTEGCEKWNCGGRGKPAPPYVNGNWVNFQLCNGGGKDTCHDCKGMCQLPRPRNALVVTLVFIATWTVRRRIGKSINVQYARPLQAKRKWRG